MDIYCDNVKLKPSGFKWSSNKPECVSVVGGIVKGKKTGYARVTAEKNKKTVSCMVYVYNKTQTVPFKTRGQVTITRDSDLTLEPEKLGKGITYTSSDYNVANVTADGKVIPYKEGKVTITCCSYGTSKYVSKIVVVIGKAARDISIKKQACFGNRRENPAVDVKAVPANRVLSAIKYSSDDSTVASVDHKGQIIGKSPGRADTYSDCCWC